MALRRFWLFFVLLGVIIGVSYFMVSSTPQPQPKFVPYQSGLNEAESGRYYTLRDSRGRVVLQTGLPVSVGDEFINEDNLRYRVSSVQGWEGTIEKMKAKPAPKQGLSSLLAGRQAVQAPLGTPPRIAIYCTHSDESYLPSQGEQSQPGTGAIYRVGYSLASSLVEDGITVDQSFAVHDPHDINAYQRSRRTLLDLLRKAPVAAFDVHRDSAPASPYFTYITGVEASKIMIVVGRQNPNMGANMAFAEQVKRRTDELYPGLIRGIFIGRGSYNQDLFPRALLVEIGTSELPEQMAKSAAQCLGDAIATIF